MMKYQDLVNILNLVKMIQFILKLFEGDTIIQSRFGQSIRFSGYNNSERKLHPSIIIRNRENNNSQNELV